MIISVIPVLNPITALPVDPTRFRIPSIVFKSKTKLIQFDSAHPATM
jgi:hypothetical protein